ncbi:MAG TPA: MerR family transcriptional regulator [Pseudonocardiaceae bacterium]|nr:MerR family transcriptional regulator [Pseudonocardiaceae bacterium]
MDAVYSIGDLARLTGVAVTAIRFYSDHGILPPATRTAAGYRRYTEADRDRLELVRTLRDLGLDLPTVAAVLRGDAELGEVAAERAQALAEHIRLLRVRHAVLVAVAERGADAEELMRLYAREVVEEFLDEVFDRPGFAGLRTTMTPYLPEDPEPEQLAAWEELAALTQDDEFRGVMRALVARYDPTMPPRKDAIAEVWEQFEAGGELVTPVGVTIHDLELANDPRRARYVELLAIVNGWAPPESLSPALSWAIAALRSFPAS